MRTEEELIKAIGKLEEKKKEADSLLFRDNDRYNSLCAEITQLEILLTLKRIDRRLR